MRRQRSSYLLILALTITTLGLVILRRRAAAARQLEQGDSLWRIEYQIQCRSTAPGAALSIGLPENTRHCRLLRQNLSHPQLHTSSPRSRLSGHQRLQAVTPAPGLVQLNAQFDLHLSANRKWPSLPEPEALSTEVRAHYLQSTPRIQCQDPVVVTALDQLLDHGAVNKPTTLVMKIFEFCNKQLSAESTAESSDAVSILRAGGDSPIGRLQAMAALCRAAQLPARLVTGFELAEAASARPHHWLEVWVNDSWTPFDPVYGYAGTLPAALVPVSYDVTRVISASDEIAELQAEYSVFPLADTQGVFIQQQPRLSNILDLRRLPLSIRQTIAIILLLPLGALLTAVLRSIVGVRTFGTFSPSLLALSFVYSDWHTGLVILATALTVAFIGRAALDRLRLLMVPRLGVVLTLIVLCMVFAVSVLDFVALTPIARVVLLPLVILTMLVERFFVAIEEDGWGSSLKLGTQTLMVALGCYLLMHWQALGELVLAYPEIHLISIAAFIALGRYTGYRLTELWRFKDFFGNQHRGPVT